MAAQSRASSVFEVPGRASVCPGNRTTLRARSVTVARSFDGPDAPKSPELTGEVGAERRLVIIPKKGYSSAEIQETRSRKGVCAGLRRCKRCPFGGRSVVVR